MTWRAISSARARSATVGTIPVKETVTSAVPHVLPGAPGRHRRREVLFAAGSAERSYFEWLSKLASGTGNFGSRLDLSDVEHAAIWRLVARVRAILERQHRPQGYNLGVNVGVAAGQTVEHAHLHVIPRYAGDVPEPRGGLRWIIPAKLPIGNSSRDWRGRCEASKASRCC